MTEPRWIRIDQSKYDTPTEVGMPEPADVELGVFLSPFDIPRSVRGYYEGRRERFVIEFEYITDEPRKTENFGPSGVTAIIGKKTNRILGFEIDVVALGAKSVSLRMHVADQVHKAIAAAREAAPPDDPWSRGRLNSYVTDRVLQDLQDEVFAGMN